MIIDEKDEKTINDFRFEIPGSLPHTFFVGIKLICI